jgi:uncharacterized protein
MHVRDQLIRQTTTEPWQLFGRKGRRDKMKCPFDDSQLLISERTGIEIDYCPACRGIWLDRGELDKIIERSATASLSLDNNDLDSHRGGFRGERKKRRGNWLGDLFDS